MPAIAWSTQNNYVQPVPAWRFYCTLPTIPGLAVDGQVLSFLVQKLVGTHRGVDYEQVPFQAGMRNFPTGHHTEAISISFLEDSSFSVIQYLSGWIDQVVDSNGRFGLPANYKRPIVVDSLDETGNVIGTFGWTACSPTKPDSFDWDGTQTDYLRTGCVFVTDNQMPFRAGSSGSTGGAGGSAAPASASSSPPSPSGVIST